MPRRSGVTTFAGSEVFAAEGAFAVMAGHTALRFPGRVVIERFGRRHLSALRLARAHLVTFVAGNFLVLGVAEADAKGRHHFRCTRVATQLVTGPTRRDIATAGLRARSVATPACCMRIEAGRYRHRDAAARFAMTGRATHVAHA